MGVRPDRVLAAGVAAIRGIGAGVLAPFRGLDEGGLADRPLPVDWVGAVAFGQPYGVPALPDPGLIPAP